MAAFGAAGAGAALSPLLSGFGGSMLINSLFASPASHSQFSLPNIIPPSISAPTAPSVTTSTTNNEHVSSMPHPAAHQQPQAMIPFAAAAAAASAAASFSDPHLLSQYSAALSALPSSSAASSLFSMLSSTHNLTDEGSNMVKGSSTILNQNAGENGGGKVTETLMDDITSKTSSIADLRMKAKRHQEALGIDEKN